ncbi:MAG: hypothetical protein H0T71_10845, partial [Acidobacteria bacterium]|nr:hypothetical protein [Acidobacteriota bacterium]
MSSATSIDDPGLRPWQFFLLAGMLSATGVVLVAAGQPPASIIVLSLTVVAASFVALGAYRFLIPLVAPETIDAGPLIVGRTRAAIEREKTLVLRSIKELEFDSAMGKISKSDFDDMGTRLRARAIGLIRQLDEAGGYRATIEQELAGMVASPRTNPRDASRSADDGKSDADTTARHVDHPLDAAPTR